MGPCRLSVVPPILAFGTWKSLELEGLQNSGRRFRPLRGITTRVQGGKTPWRWGFRPSPGLLSPIMLFRIDLLSLWPTSHWSLQLWWFPSTRLQQQQQPRPRELEADIRRSCLAWVWGFYLRGMAQGSAWIDTAGRQPSDLGLWPSRPDRSLFWP